MSLCLSSQLLSAVLLLLRLWESGTREMDNERSTQGTSAPLLPLLQRFQNIHGSKEEPVPEDEAEVNSSPLRHRTIREQELSETINHLMMVCCLVCCLGTPVFNLFPN